MQTVGGGRGKRRKIKKEEHCLPTIKKKRGVLEERRTGPQHRLFSSKKAPFSYSWGEGRKKKRGERGKKKTFRRVLREKKERKRKRNLPPLSREKGKGCKGGKRNFTNQREPRKEEGKKRKKEKKGHWRGKSPSSIEKKGKKRGGERG